MPDFGFRVTRKQDCWCDEVPELYERAKSEQWDATHDIPWHKLPELPEDIERAVCQLMTFLVENEYVALAIPAKFIPLIDPHYTEVSLLLATQVKDEARHIEVYTKRALANGAASSTCPPPPSGPLRASPPRTTTSRLPSCSTCWARVLSSNSSSSSRTSPPTP